jgi:hypothetical protein
MAPESSTLDREIFHGDALAADRIAASITAIPWMASSTGTGYARTLSGVRVTACVKRSFALPGVETASTRR